MPNEKILVSDGLAEEGLDILRKAGEVTVNPKISADELLKQLPDYTALVVRSRTKVTAQVIETGKRLKVIGRAGVGVDNIDVKAASKCAVMVVNSPLAATIAVAEHTLALMLALARQIPAADVSMKHRKWKKNVFIGVELFGKTLGLVGMGRIGTQVAILAKAFGMEVKAFDPYVRDEEVLSRGVNPSSFREVLESADYISLHLPLTVGTRGILGENEFGLVKKGARLVCTARGGLIDEVALRQALDAGVLAGAALDVFASEPPATGSIAEHPKVIATPHIAAQTAEAQTRAGIAIAEEVTAVLQGDQPRWKVTSSD